MKRKFIVTLAKTAHVLVEADSEREAIEVADKIADVGDLAWESGWEVTDVDLEDDR